MRNKKLDIYDIALRIIIVILGAMVIVGLHFLRRAYVADQFVIPTESMEPTLIAGDRVIVNKLIIGARIYDDFEFEEGRTMQSHRIRGLRRIEHNDIIVFNFPLNWDKHKIEFKINYVYAKRCIGQPSDTVSIRNGYFHSNNFKLPLGDTEQQRNLSLTPDSILPGNVLNSYNGWTIKDFGPLYVPAKGGRIPLDTKNYKVYELPIEFETGKQLDINSEGVLLLGDAPIEEYIFTKDYYFVCGDNAANSQDSRYWGFVPEEFVIGVISHITYSRDRHTNKFRWDRFMKSVLKN